MTAEPCNRCAGTRKLRSGAWCPSCTHEITWHPKFRGQGGSHRVSCSCGWRHVETARQNALGRASKMRGAVTKHLREVEAKA
jgi:hypothetical protein